MSNEEKFAIRLPAPTGGKAGKGCNKTSTIRVVERNGGGFLIRKQFRFTMGNETSLRNAYAKARLFLKTVAPKL